MRKDIQVFSCDSNPAVDSPVFHVTRTEADVRIEKGFAVWLSPTSIQTRPPGWTGDEEKLVAGGVIRQAWRQKWSDCYIVLQMVTRDEDEVS
jgi:hypothetical protein